MNAMRDLLGDALDHHVSGRLEAARSGYRIALTLEPAQAAAADLLGVLETQTSGDGIAWLARACRLNPDAAAPHAHLGKALLVAGRPCAASSALRRAVALDPGDADALDAFGLAEHALNRYESAAQWLARAVEAAPGRPDTLVNLGVVLRDARRFAQADARFAEALALAPGRADVHLARAVGRLVRGDLAAGWEGFERRWRRFPSPAWAGEAVEGRTVLLHAEQGFGDTIQFARYAPMLARRGARVVLAVQPGLVRLLRGLDPAVMVLAQSDPPPAHDAHCPLLSLPRGFGTTLATVPAQIPYLAADPEAAAAWRERLAARPGLRVAFVWAGNPKHINDRNRSIPVDALAPLFGVPGIRPFSLQTADAARSAHRLPLENLEPHIRDFADTAAVLANLDLVVAVDTAVAHLAGAMGRPCWVLLPYAPDWRWLLERSDSPWYPSLRLFRQERPGDWGPVIGKVAAALSEAGETAMMKYR